MPLYEFRCHGCQNQYEVLTKLGDMPPCPECGSAEVVQVLTSFVVGRKRRKPPPDSQTAVSSGSSAPMEITLNDFEARDNGGYGIAVDGPYRVSGGGWRLHGNAKGGIRGRGGARIEPDGDVDISS